MVHKRASPAGGAFLHPDQWKREDENQQSSITVRMTTVAESTISALLAQWDEYGLYELTKYYRDRLEQAIEEGVKTLRCMSGQEGHFRAEEHEKVTELKGNRIESFRLFISLVMGKDSQTRRVMWESIVKMRTELQKLDKILKDIQVLGPDPQEYMNIAQGLSELPTQLIDKPRPVATYGPSLDPCSCSKSNPRFRVPTKTQIQGPCPGSVAEFRVPSPGHLFLVHARVRCL
ncbi:uncharacterized protein [Hemitrygon akajei]|uniref:uncharacterized protein n=1 Tax=Hemitrygon akajei TaxID=2704970 RepID=UPI003BF951EC